MKKKYVLMHRNTETAVIELNESNAVLSSQTLNKEEIPFGCDSQKNMANWIERRAIPKTQQNKPINLQLETTFDYMIKNLGLSLIDNYWLKPVGSDYTWEDINLYNHNFAEFDFQYEDLENITPFKPSATTQGELQKRWIIKNNERYLVKGNYDSMCRQSLNEVFTTMVHTMQGVEHTKYELVDLPSILGWGIGCISKNFTTENLEFIPAFDVTFARKKKNEESVLQQYINTCVELGIPKEEMQHWMDYQIMSDFLLTNTDRHLLNLGILRDVNTLKAVSPAPYFDTGNSMFYRSRYIPKEVLNIPTTSFYKTEIKMLEKVKDRNVLDLSKLPSETDIRKLYEKDEYSKVYLDNMLMGYGAKIACIEHFQKGLSLNPRSTLFNIVQNEETLSDNIENEEDYETDCDIERE